MKILKKSGKTVDFLPTKIKTSMENSADDTSQIINEKEIGKSYILGEQ